MNEHLDNQWWCIIAEASGQLWREFAYRRDDGVIDHCGPVLMFDVKDEAEARAATLRAKYPLLIITAIPAPLVPPQVCRGPREPARLAAVQFTLFVASNTNSLGAEMIQVELRPVMPESDKLVLRAAEILRRRVSSAIEASPARIIRLGLLDESAADTTTPDTEAA